MLMSAIEFAEFDAADMVSRYPELAGKRVLITGVSSRVGVDIVRAFAEHKTRLVLQLDEDNETTQALSMLAAEAALDVKVFHTTDTADETAIVTFARKASAAFGGLDAVINIVTLDAGTALAANTLEAVEQQVSTLLLQPCLVGRVAANRMRIIHTEGLVLTIAMMPPPTGLASEARARTTFAGVAKAALQAMTRREGEAWADQAIRFNAVAPATVGAMGNLDGPPLAGEAAIARLALFLASGRGKTLSGHTFDADISG